MPDFLGPAVRNPCWDFFSDAEAWGDSGRSVASVAGKDAWDAAFRDVMVAGTLADVKYNLSEELCLELRNA